MRNKQTNSNLSKIWLLVPCAFLEQFDKETKNNYSSRSEAIRRGMSLILNELTQLKTQTPQQEKTQIFNSQEKSNNQPRGS